LHFMGIIRNQALKTGKAICSLQFEIIGTLISRLMNAVQL